MAPKATRWWRALAWSFLGISLLPLVAWPLMIWWRVSHGVPLAPAVLETLLWPLGALLLWLVARAFWQVLVDG
jgi:hypothetical protein